MPKKGGKKGGGKKGKKKKGPSIYTSEEDTRPFGFKVNDILRTPLGLSCTVTGVKYEDAENKTGARLWVRYIGGHEAPLEPRLGQGTMTNLGYRRCPESDHIRRDIDIRTQEVKEMEEKRRLAEENARRAALGLPPIVPDGGGGKGKKGKGKKGGGGKKKKKK